MATDNPSDGRQIVAGDPDTPLYFHYDSSYNISMRGSEDADCTVGEWNAMTREQQVDAMQDLLWQLIDITPSTDEDYHR